MKRNAIPAGLAICRRVPEAARCLFLMGIVLVSSSGCPPARPVALGSSGEVTVVTDASSGDRVLEALLAILREPVPFAREETRFRAEVIAPAGFDGCRHGRCLVLLVDLASPGPLAVPLRRLLAPAELADMRAAPFAYRVVRDGWARGQSVLVVHVRGDEGAVRLDRDAPKMIATLEAGLTESLLPAALAAGEDRTLERRLVRDYGLALRVPRGWHLQGDPARGVVRLYDVDETGGARFLLVAVMPADRATDDPDSLLALRNRLGEEWGDGDHADPSVATARAGSFQRRPATIIEGTWQNSRYRIGGLFHTCAFVRDGRFFLLDAAAFRPGEAKLPILREVAAIAGTFRSVEAS